MRSAGEDLRTPGAIFARLGPNTSGITRRRSARSRRLGQLVGEGAARRRAPDSESGECNAWPVERTHCGFAGALYWTMRERAFRSRTRCSKTATFVTNCAKALWPFCLNESNVPVDDSDTAGMRLVVGAEVVGEASSFSHCARQSGVNAVSSEQHHLRWPACGAEGLA